MAGYSPRPLITKLGIRPHSRVCILNGPDYYRDLLVPFPTNVTLASRLTAPADFIQFFTTSSDQLEARFPALKQALAHDGSLWISWPKQASGVPTDLNENRIRDIGLRYGLVDVKVAAIDSVWSGLKFVYRLRDR